MLQLKTTLKTIVIHDISSIKRGTEWARAGNLFLSDKWGTKEIGYIEKEDWEGVTKWFSLLSEHDQWQTDYNTGQQKEELKLKMNVQ